MLVWITHVAWIVERDASIAKMANASNVLITTFYRMVHVSFNAQLELIMMQINVDNAQNIAQTVWVQLIVIAALKVIIFLQVLADKLVQLQPIHLELFVLLANKNALHAIKLNFAKHVSQDIYY